MSLDSLSPIAPARVRALVVPVGHIKTERFITFLDRLRSEHVVQLRDVSPDGRPNRNMFSPSAFPDGAVFYDFTTHVPPPSHLALSPFDLFREPFSIIAVADGSELSQRAISKRHSPIAPTTTEQNIRALYQELEDLRDHYHRALIHHVVIFDYVSPSANPVPLPEGVITIPPLEDCTTTTMKTAICGITSVLLAEMTSRAKVFESMNVIESPGQAPSPRTNGDSWAREDPGHLRRNSQFSLPSSTRSSSASGLPDRTQARMSMPPVSSKGSPAASNQSTPARSSTPVRSGLSNPPTTFDEISSDNFSEVPTIDQAAPGRPASVSDASKPSSNQDRVSVHGFGSGGMTERWRNKGRGRVLVILGSLYLQAGRWSDALKELSEGATVARSINDHIWHGKALELITVSLLLLGWARIEFQVPSVCLPQDKASAATVTALEAATPDDPSQPRHLRRLQVALPDLLDRITGLYSRISAENLPPLPLAEVTIRFSKLLSALHLADGKLGEQALNMMVLGTMPEKPLTTSPRLSVTPTRQQITTLLFRAFPSSSSELLTTVDRSTILAGIASVLGPIGHQRKKAMVIRELVSVLISGLVEARTRGAADVGIHPAAGLVALNAATGQGNGAGALELGEGDVEQGIEGFLGLLCKSYGVVGFDPIAKGSTSTVNGEQATLEDTIKRIRGQSAARFFGFPGIKLNILRACINFSEALPDFGGVLKYSSDLLRSAGSGIAPGPRKEDASASIFREEQVRLATNIAKTSHLSKRLGLHHLAAEYWDEFLVRDVILEPLPITRLPVPHAKSVLPGATTARTSQDVNPFIYNPFLKAPDKAAVSHILVAGEPATFKVLLQNPYDVEVEIESLKLDGDGVEFEPLSEPILVGPYRTQTVKVSGIPKAAGSLNITGAVVHIHGCRERSFPIFKQQWKPENQVKIKGTGVAALEEAVTTAVATGRSLVPQSVSLKVIPPQPVVVVKSTTLPQSSIMVLEGERQIFSVTLENLSKTCPVDFLLFSFEDSTQAPLQAALSNRDATPAELYEYEFILMKRQALRKVAKADSEKRYIAPGGTATFDFEVLGKPGLTSAALQVDYAHLGVPPDEIIDDFHTRRVSLQLMVTVNAGVELARLDVLPLQGSVPRSLWKTEGQVDDADDQASPDDYCLLSMDLRNAWPSNMLVQLEGEHGLVLEEQILPGNTARVMVPVRRVYLEDPHASIPALNPKRQRQFVVSSGKISPDMERTNRESFWYRERILDGLIAKWKTLTGPARSGFVELRTVRFTPRMIEAIKVDEVGIDFSVFNGGPDTSAAGGHGDHQTLYLDEFAKIKVQLSNRTAQPIYPLLRIMPALRHRPLNVALDFTRKFAWNGTLQQSLPILAPHETRSIELGVTALCRGEFELAASVEELQMYEEPQVAGEKAVEVAKGRRPRSDTQTMLDAVLGSKERRVWHSRQPCIVMVKDRKE
ncbi:hypercellular protein A [Plectosphaerella plurivora]|uniref:Hypercellular protein A n=1 Tax=Plectosphaerella plurivora TaxID=936078 RepID=A0A9P8VBC9_9PEZI|nr:hypercellular protein A [Plectosphaerella plurivora]